MPLKLYNKIHRTYGKMGLATQHSKSSSVTCLKRKDRNLMKTHLTHVKHLHIVNTKDQEIDNYLENYLHFPCGSGCLEEGCVKSDGRLCDSRCGLSGLITQGSEIAGGCLEGMCMYVLCVPTSSALPVHLLQHFPLLRLTFRTG